MVTGDEIIAELIRNAEAGAFKIRYTVLLPSVFHVYLHEKDWETVRPVADFVRREAERALDEHVATLNKKKREAPALVKKLGLGGTAKPTFKPLQQRWEITFQKDSEERLGEGEIEIYSDFGAEQTELGVGEKTTFITRKPAGIAATSDSGTQALASFQYSDQSGGKTFLMTREEIVIGRGGKAVWVDLKLEGPADISREHCRIRRDKNGRFWIRDLSQFGTAVNGTKLEGSIERNGSGDKMDRGIESELRSPSRITLADVMTLNFEAR